MREPERQNAALTREADAILHDYGLLDTLKEYGRPYVTGSYALGLMSRRDLDVNVETSIMTAVLFKQLRNKVVRALNLYNQQYLNEFKERHPRLPLGYYIGGSTVILGTGKEWGIDIWTMDSQQAEANRKILKQLKASINPANRLIILEIKQACLKDSGYQHRYFSMDIYRAVTEGGINRADDFLKWAEKNLTTDLTV